MAFSFCSFADFVSDLQRYVPTSSNASMVPYGSFGSVENTVDLSDIVIRVYIAEPDGTDLGARTIPGTITSEGRLSYRYTDQDHYIYRIEFAFGSGAIPPVGNYSFSMDVTSDFSYDVKYVRLWTTHEISNAQRETKIIEFPFQTLSGDAYVDSYDITLTNVSAFTPFLSIGNQVHNVSGSVAFSFVSSSASGESTAGSDTSQQDWENGISSSLGDISSSLSSVDESLEYISQSQNLIIQGIDNVILHISDQLYAFWDQLYNLIHVPTMAKLDDIIDAINNLKLDVTVDLDELLDTLNQNHEDQIANDNAIADQIQNGYDDSSLSSDNDRLNTVIDQYDDVEDQLFTDSKDYISNFEFTDSLAPFLGPLTAISGFLSGIYVALGSLNIPIAFSLSLSIALLMIGWYRFRGGG